MIKIKPHHFMDIINLYGKGIDRFIPDDIYGHNFYNVANTIINLPETGIMITSKEDDICMPCKFMKDGKCTDCISHIKNITSKDEYNRILDKRIMHFININENYIFSAHEFCNILYKNKNIIYRVWRDEDKDKTDIRYKLFCAGAEKFLKLI